ncbi:MAG: DNA repair protein RadC [Syntrophomonadaceae bacterium]|jgi:DNA repair protein RadC|nr:DNA repair protein RadC [Syntrophomonadaceae bacterium]
MPDYYATIKDMPEDMRPREKLLFHGETLMTDAEILAIILRNGTLKVNVLTLADQIINHYGNLRSLKDSSVEELMTIKGVGEAKAITIKAALELGRRIALSYSNKMAIKNPEDVKNAVMEEMRYFDREHFRAMYLDRKSCLIVMEDISVGGLHSSAVHPREVFKTALKRSAASIILIHNHPSGDPTPSPDDIEVTKRLIEVSKIMGIDIIDHIIIGENKFCSLKRQNLI